MNKSTSTQPSSLRSTLAVSLNNYLDAGAIVAGASLSSQIVLLFGLAETISGVVLKNWTIKIAGFLTGIGGLATYYFVGTNEEQLLLFTFAGVVLAATGLIVKQQYK